MAWKARVADKQLNPAAGTLTLDVDYFDDQQPGTVIVRHSLVFPPHATLAEMQSEVVNVGRQERAKRQALETLSARVSVGTEVAI